MPEGVRIFVRLFIRHGDDAQFSYPMFAIEHERDGIHGIIKVGLRVSAFGLRRAHGTDLRQNLNLRRVEPVSERSNVHGRQHYGHDDKDDSFFGHTGQLTFGDAV